MVAVSIIGPLGKGLYIGLKGSVELRGRMDDLEWASGLVKRRDKSDVSGGILGVCGLEAEKIPNREGARTIGYDKEIGLGLCSGLDIARPA